jgi:GDP-4-dehydro-6-deoxy-D-mannose reductase
VASRLPERVLVTGAGGFVGGHLLAYLSGLEQGPGAVLAVDRSPRQAPRGAVDWASCDLTSRAQVSAVVAGFRPDAILHLAAVVGESDLEASFAANVQAAEVVLSEASRLPRPPRLVVVGSAAQYGEIGPGASVVSETQPLRGETPYAVSKILQERWALLYWAARSLPVICTRPFNLLGPGQSTKLVPATFLAQVRQVLRGEKSHVEVGNLSSRRDFVDVRDAVAAFWSLVTTGPEADGQVFNVAAGVSTGIEELLDACLELGGGGVPVRRSGDRVKPVDVSSVTGDPAKLRAQTGWRSVIPWRQSLADMWRHLESPAGGRSI